MFYVAPVDLTAVLTSSTVTEPDATLDGTTTAWLVGSTYSVLNELVVDEGRVYKNVNTTGNTGKKPKNEPTFWDDRGPTNRRKAFDVSPETQTQRATDMQYVWTPTDWVDTLWIENVDGQSARLVQTDADDGVVFDSGVVSLIDDLGIRDPYRYCFEPIVRKGACLFAGLKPYIGSELELTVTDTGGTAKVGEIICGKSVDMGGTRDQHETGFRDFSIKEKDEFGGTVVQERGYAKTGSFDLVVPSARTPSLKRQLESRRAKPTLFVGDVKGEHTMIYGFFIRVRIVATETRGAQKVDFLSIEVEGFV